MNVIDISLISKKIDTKNLYLLFKKSTILGSALIILVGFLSFYFPLLSQLIFVLALATTVFNLCLGPIYFFTQNIKKIIFKIGVLLFLICYILFAIYYLKPISIFKSVIKLDSYSDIIVKHAWKKESNTYILFSADHEILSKIISNKKLVNIDKQEMIVPEKLIKYFNIKLPVKDNSFYVNFDYYLYSIKCCLLIDTNAKLLYYYENNDSHSSITMISGAILAILLLFGLNSIAILIGIFVSQIIQKILSYILLRKTNSVN